MLSSAELQLLREVSTGESQPKLLLGSTASCQASSPPSGRASSVNQGNARLAHAKLGMAAQVCPACQKQGTLPQAASPQRRRPELFSAPRLDSVQLEHQRHCRSCPGQVRWFKYLSNTTATTGLQLKQTNHQIYCKGKGTPATLSLSTEQCRYELQEQVRGEAILKWRANYLSKFKLNRVTPQCNRLQMAA